MHVMAKTLPVVGVVIPAYNATASLLEAVEGALNQDPPAGQVVVVDDGSEENMAVALQPYAHRVDYIRVSHRGSSAARNAGLDRLKTDAVMFLDADDLLLPGALACRMALMAGGEAAWGYTEGFVQNRSGEQQLFSSVHPPVEGRVEGWLFEDLLRRNFITTDAAIIRRDALLKLGGFDETISGTEDWDLWLRLAGSSPALYSQQPTFVYRLGANSLSSDRQRMDRMRFRTLVKADQLHPDKVRRASRAARQSVADAHNGLGMMDAQSGDWGHAKAHFGASLRLCPVQGRAWGWWLRSCVQA